MKKPSNFSEITFAPMLTLPALHLEYHTFHQPQYSWLLWHAGSAKWTSRTRSNKWIMWVDIVEPSVMTTVQNLGIADGKDEDTCDVCSDSETCHGSGTKKSGKSKSKQKKSTKETGGNKGSVAHNGQTLNGNLLWLLHTHEQSHCLEVEKNNIWKSRGAC